MIIPKTQFVLILRNTPKDNLGAHFHLFSLSVNWTWTAGKFLIKVFLEDAKSSKHYWMQSLGYKYHLQVTTPLGCPKSGSNMMSRSSRKMLYSCQIDRLAAPTRCFSHFPVFPVCILPFSSFWPSQIWPPSQAGLLCKPCLPLQAKKAPPS